MANETVRTAMTHIDSQRLRQVAESETLIFTAEEYEHLKRCTDCFPEWSQDIHDFVREQPRP